MPTLPLSLPRLLRLDSRAGLTVGVLVLALTPWLHALYGLPRAFLLVSGAANLCYGTCSGWLARQPVHSPPAVMTLVAANALWALVCVAATVAFARSASVIGLLTLWGEALFVGTLAWMEWRALRRVTP